MAKSKFIGLFLFFLVCFSAFGQDCRNYFSRYNLAAQDIETKKIKVVTRSDYTIQITLLNDGGDLNIGIYYSDQYMLNTGDKITFYSTESGNREFEITNDVGGNKLHANISLAEAKWFSTAKVNRLMVNRVGRDMRKYTLAFDVKTVISKYGKCYYKTASSIQRLSGSGTEDPDETKTTTPKGTGNEGIKEVSAQVIEARKKAEALKKQYSSEVRKAKENSDKAKSRIAEDLSAYTNRAADRKNVLEKELAQLERSLLDKRKKEESLDKSLEAKQKNFDLQSQKLDSNLATYKAKVESQVADLKSNKNSETDKALKEMEATKQKAGELKKDLAKQLAEARQANTDSILAYRQQRNRELAAIDNKATQAKKRILEDLDRSLNEYIEELKKTKKKGNKELEESQARVLEIQKELSQSVYQARKDTAEKISEMKGAASQQMKKIQEGLAEQKKDLLKKDSDKVSKTQIEEGESAEEARAKAEAIKKEIYAEVNASRAKAAEIKKEIGLDVAQARKDSAEKIAEIRVQAAQEIKDYQARVAEQKSQLAEQVKTERSKATSVLDDIKTEIQAEIERSKKDAEKIKNELGQEVSNARKDTAQKIAEIRKSAAEEIKLIRQQLVDEKKEMRADRAAFQSNFKDSLGVLKKQFAEERAMLIKEGPDSLRKLKAEILAAQKELQELNDNLSIETQRNADKRAFDQTGPLITYASQWAFEKEELVRRKLEMDVQPLINDGKQLKFKTTFLGKACTEDYQFEENKLKAVTTSFELEEDRAVASYYEMLTLLRKKFGEPIILEEKWTKNKYKDDREQWNKAVRLGHVEFRSTFQVGQTTLVHTLTGDGKKLQHKIVNQRGS